MKRQPKKHLFYPLSDKGLKRISVINNASISDLVALVGWWKKKRGECRPLGERAFSIQLHKNTKIYIVNITMPSWGGGGGGGGGALPPLLELVLILFS